MNLLMRVIRFLALIAFNLLGSLIAVFVRLLLLPFLLATLRILLELVFISLTATVIGPMQYIDRLASDWTGRLIALGADRDRINEIYSLCRFMAASVIVLGWIVSTLFTVVIFRVIYGWLFI